MVAGEDYVRTKKEARGWPNKRMPITLCKKHAEERLPLTSNQIDIIMNKIFPSTLLMLCLFVIGCQAQDFIESKASISPVGSVLTTGPNKSIIGVDPAVFKGMKGDTGPAGPKGEKGDSAEIIPQITGGWQENLTASANIGSAISNEVTPLQYIVVAGTVKTYDGSLVIKYSYIDGAGVEQVGSYEVTKTGSYSTGLIPIYTKPKTLMRIYTEATDVLYDIVYKFHGL